MGIIIGSFNMAKFSSGSEKDLDMIRKIIDKAEVDILALQEIFNKDALYDLLEVLGDSWDGRWDKPDSRSRQAEEGYAFLWNTHRIRLSHDIDNNCIEPVILGVDGGILFRSPFYGRFELANSSRVEIRLINAHINSSKKGDDSEENKGVGAVSERNIEYEYLAEVLLPKVDDKCFDLFLHQVDGYCRKPITILLGDYNLNLKVSDAKDSFICRPIIPIKEGKSEKIIVTVQKDLTTLKKDLTHIDLSGAYKNNFDHFTYDEKRYIEVKCWALRSPEDPELYNGDYEKYNKKVSNHLMIIMDLELT